MTSSVSLEDRFVGSILGVAVGDALGKWYEGVLPENFAHLYESPKAYVDNPPAEELRYTDDTQMTIAVAEALLLQPVIEEETLCRCFVENYQPWRGYGRGARVVLDAMEDGGDYRYHTEKQFPGGSYGNGAAMRAAPIGLFFHRDMDQVWEQARLSAWPTHVHPLGIEGAQLIAAATAWCLRNDSFNRDAFFSELESRATLPEFQDLLRRARQVEDPDGLPPLGNGIAAQESVVTAIACFALSPDDFSQTVGQAVLLGGDSDTIAAMAGGISGAFLGPQVIPQHLLDKYEDFEGLKGITYIENLARRLWEAHRSCFSPPESTAENAV
ncbi:MAG: ADP-ribosylglycohydrolase family protein [Planctomycetales bacterium]